MENDMNNLQVSMNHKRIAIDNNIAIDFMEEFPINQMSFLHFLEKAMYLIGKLHT